MIYFDGRSPSVPQEHELGDALWVYFDGWSHE